MAKNFLLITPNIIVLDRIKTDFEGLKIFYEDPILPDNGYGGQNWQDDFQIKLRRSAPYPRSKKWRDLMPQ